MKKKLTSRKFWLAVIGFVASLLVVFGVEDIKIEQICALVGALGSIIAYIFAESYVDSRTGEKSDGQVEEKSEEIVLFDDGEEQNQEKQ